MADYQAATSPPEEESCRCCAGSNPEDSFCICGCHRYEEDE